DGEPDPRHRGLWPLGRGHAGSRAVRPGLCLLAYNYRRGRVYGTEL
ncbi:MAG: hypothetical protein AVDCRST_MAG27-428, partial [uncultured Craurococcus sp.]